MDDEAKKMVRMTAAMEGQEAIVASTGKKVSLSEMEIICLVNFAEIGLMSVFSGLEGPVGEEAEKSLNQHLDLIRETFGTDGINGLNRLSITAAAMLRGKKLSRYMA